ncbi:MAG TPA: xanthine dehydrogenase family protein molybdopterin-binding subunit [Nitrososphaerales archaeon]|nr:xanthine dehydrogenase family protein molybdopterin-binding subunit [Nitrososphaerales archaeon]
MSSTITEEIPRAREPKEVRVDLVEEINLGQPIKRVEDRQFMRGAKCYVDDLQLPGMLYASILRSPYAHARILSVEKNEALLEPRVKAVVTGKEALEVARPLQPRYLKNCSGLEQYCLAIDKTRFVGEPVAAVAASDRYAAEDALEKISVIYEPLAAVTTAEEAALPDAPLLYDGAGSNVVWKKTFTYGEVDRDFENADHIIRGEFSVHRYSSTALEPISCIASFDEPTGQLTVWCNTPFPGYSADAISRVFSIPSNKIRVIVPSIGGNFGNKTTMTRYIMITCLLSIKTKRPVKWIETRYEHLISSTQAPEQKISAELAVRKNGTMLAIKIKEIVNEGADAEFAAYHTQGRLQTIVGLYKIRSVRLDGRVVLTNTCPSGPNRGVAKPAMGFVLERMVNISARVVGIDPIRFRLLNYIRPEEFPYVTPSGQCYDSGEYEATLKKALTDANFLQWVDYQKAAREHGRCVGIGIATCVEPGGYNSAGSFLITGKVNKTGGYEPALVKMDQNAKVLVSLSGPDAGQGHATSIAQITAHLLGVPVKDVCVLDSFDTLLSPYGTMSGNYGNKFSVLDISAAVHAVLALRNKIIKIAGKALGVDESTLELRDESVFSLENSVKSLRLTEVASIAYNDIAALPHGLEPGLQQTFFYKSPYAKPPDSQGRVSTKITFGSSAHLAVIEVDRETGKIQVLHYAVVHDCGRLINPMIVDGQIQGSTAHGIAATLQEEFGYSSDGQPLSTTFIDYLAATAVETPDISVGHVETPSPHSVLGTKGMGEGGATPPLAAITNALDDAFGQFGITMSQNTLPLSPERVLNLVKSNSAIK